MIPADLLREWVGRFSAWQNFLFDTMSMRLSDILSTLEKTLFQRLDVRIANMLLELMDQDENTVLITHAELARELNSSRVAISRLLEKLSAGGVLSQQRGKILILDVLELQKIAASV
ncbi:MAG: helix-turn-helix domain-containing protein [Calditrichota bacterium]